MIGEYPDAPFWAWLVTPGLAAVLFVIARHDLVSFRVPDRFSLPLIPAGLLVAWATGAPIIAHLLGAVLGWGSFAALGAAFFRLRGRDGLGRGDAKLMGAAGAWIGVQALPLLVLMAALGALAFVLILRRDRRAAIPFAPWICAAFLILWTARLWGGG